jgi:hypothetical protein
VSSTSGDSGADAPNIIARGDSGSHNDSGSKTGSGDGSTHDAGTHDASGHDANGHADASDSGGADGGGFGDAGPVGPFPFPPVTYQGGPLMTAPNIITITFPGDTLATQLATFGASLTQSSYWDSISAGYCNGATCIGNGPTGTAVALTTAPAASYTDSTQGGPSTIQTFIAGLISTSISLDGSASCQSFDGYHGSMMVGSQEVVYAIIPECAAPQMTPAINLLQNTTITASHEAIEAASDPSDTQTAFYLDFGNQSTFGWDDVQGGEIADLCVDPFLLGQDETTENGFTVQRIWSVTNASAGKNPCVPIPAGEVYFNVFSTVNAVILSVGESATIEIDALADGPMGSWTVLPQDWTQSTTNTPYVIFSIDGVATTDAGTQTQVQSGDRLHLKVTMVADPTNTQDGEADAVLVSANGNDQTATEVHFWPFIVLTPAQATQYGVTMMKHNQPHPLSRRRSFHASR